MVKHVVSLEDKFDLSEHRQILTGTQAVVRLLLMQKERDRAARQKDMEEEGDPAVREAKIALVERRKCPHFIYRRLAISRFTFLNISE